MKNQLTKMPEDTYSREVVGGSLWTGEVFGLFYLERGCNGTDIRRSIKGATMTENTKLMLAAAVIGVVSIVVCWLI